MAGSKKIIENQHTTCFTGLPLDALLPENAPSDWDTPYLNCALACKTSLTPHDLLKEIKNIECSIGRNPEMRHWGPRTIDIDILVYDDVIIKSDKLNIPHPMLHERPWALWPLADVAPFMPLTFTELKQTKTAAEWVVQWDSRFNGSAPFHTRQIAARIDTAQLVGILNITPDSFSDGGEYQQVESALKKAVELVQHGAEILDIGGTSTAPYAARKKRAQCGETNKAETATAKVENNAETEWRRIAPVIDAIKQNLSEFIIPPKLSIDTYHASVLQKALLKGIDWLNDVSGCENPGIREILAGCDIDCVMMHHLTLPADAQVVLPRDQDGVRLVYDWAEQQLSLLEKAGIARKRIILDPGIGFGKTKEQSLALIQNMQIFSELGVRILSGHSRKSFLSLITAHQPENRDIETLVTSLYLAQKNIDYLRVHNTEICSRGLQMHAALC